MGILISLFEATIKGANAVFENLVELTFVRADNPERKVVLRAHLDDDMVDYAIEAAKKLGLGPDEEFGLSTPRGRPIRIVGRSVRDVVTSQGTVFYVASRDMLGR